MLVRVVLVVLSALLSRSSGGRGAALKVAVDGFDSEPLSILPMNHAGTHPLSPVSDLILLTSATVRDHTAGLTRMTNDCTSYTLEPVDPP
jgi:hypothetical protein